MRESTVARIYAETLFEVAREQGDVESVAAEVETLRQALRSAPELRRFLESPRIELEEKKAALRRALGGRLAPQTIRFLELVLDRERQEILSEIFDEFGDLIAELRNQQVLRVASAVPLDEALRERLRETFARATGKTIVLEERVDPALMGGVVVQLGDTRIDGSLRTRLENLRERMRRGARAAQSETAA